MMDIFYEMKTEDKMYLRFINEIFYYLSLLFTLLWNLFVIPFHFRCCIYMIWNNYIFFLLFAALKKINFCINLLHNRYDIYIDIS